MSETERIWYVHRDDPAHAAREITRENGPLNWRSTETVILPAKPRLVTFRELYSKAEVVVEVDDDACSFSGCIIVSPEGLDASAWMESSLGKAIAEVIGFER